MLSTVVFNVLGILAIIGLGSFVVILVSDLIMAVIAPKRRGVFFNRGKKFRDEVPAKAKKEQVSEPVKQETVNKIEEVSITPYAIPTITPFSEFNESSSLISNEVSNVDFDKAVEEQKLIQRKNSVKSTVNNEEVFSITKLNENNSLSAFEDSEEEIEESDDISEIIENVRIEAMKLIEEEYKEHVAIVEEVQEEVQEVKEIKDVPKVRIVKPKLIFKTQKEEVEVTEPVKEIVEIVETEKVVENKQSQDLDELRRIREDIFNLRVNAFNDLQSSKQGVVSKDKQQEIIEFEESIKDRLHEFEQYKINTETEKEALIKVNLEVKEEKEQLIKELEELESEFETLKNSAGIERKPFYSKQYYDNRLIELEEQLAEAKKDLRSNRREFNPLKRIKRTFERDVVKLRRKEAIVAKQKLKIYGVNNIENLDEEKIAKLNEEVEILTNLKDSVHKCEVILKQNKDRYPVLEKTNKILTKHVANLEKDLETVKEALDWYNGVTGNTETDAN